MDINFFEPIRKKKKKINYVFLLFFAVTSIVLTLLILLCIVKKAEYAQTKRKVNDINSMMEDPLFQKQLKSVNVKEKEIEEISERYAYLLALSASVPGYHTVREEVLRALLDELTKSLYLEKVIVTDDQLTLDGYATSIPDVTQFEYNLGHCGLFENVIVNTVQEELVTYLFSGTEIVQTVYSYKFNIQLTILDTGVPDESIEER